MSWPLPWPLPCGGPVPLEAGSILLISVGALLAGAMNALAGGGTFFSFPALLAVGVPPVVANASNTVALWPASLSSAYAFRHELARHRAVLPRLLAVALLGGIGGAWVLLQISNQAFMGLVPWLLLLATVLFAASAPLGRWLAARRAAVVSDVSRQGAGHASPAAPPLNSLGGLCFQCVVSLYGGFFGAGMGILMLAALAIQGIDDLNELNALKNLLSAAIYSVSTVTFIVAGAVSWPHTLIMLVAASLGGYGGALLARRLPAVWLRRFIILVGAVLTMIYFYRG